MADITLLGATYTDVPAVDLPKSGGGTARFYERCSLMELLWTNPSPTSSFSAQTKTFTDTYDYYVITYRYSTEYGVSATVLLPTGITENVGANYGSDSYYRSVTTNSNSISFGTGNSNDNKRIIPYFIFGIKTLSN